MITAVAVDRTGDRVLVGAASGGLWLRDFTGGPGVEYIVPAEAPPAEAGPRLTSTLSFRRPGIRPVPGYRPDRTPADLDHDNPRSPGDVPWTSRTPGELPREHPVPGLPGRSRPPPRRLVDDDVRFTVYRPPVLSRGRWASLLVFVHKTTPVVEPGRGPFDPQEQVAARARAHFGGAPPSPVGEDAARPIARGDRLRIVPDLPGIGCNPNKRRGRVVGAGARGLVPAARRARTRWDGRPRGSPGLVRRAHPRRGVHHGPRCRERPGRRAAADAVDSARRYRKIFPSYSHRDSAVVANFAAVVRALGDQYLQDVLALRAGERWHARLLAADRRRGCVPAVLVPQLHGLAVLPARVGARTEHCSGQCSCGPCTGKNPCPRTPGRNCRQPRCAALHFVKVPVGAGPIPPHALEPSVLAYVRKRYPEDVAWAQQGLPQADYPAMRRRRFVSRRRVVLVLAALILLLGVIGAVLILHSAG